MTQDPDARTFSYSGLKTFKQCPLRYKLEYMDGRRTGIEFVEAFTGSRVHDALRRLYEDLWEGDLPELENLWDFYNFKWDEEWHSGVRIVRRNTRVADYFNFGLGCIENFYRSNWPFDGSRTVLLEGKATFRFSGWVSGEFRGKIDRISLRGDGTYEIHEYKTSRREPGRYEAEEIKTQLSLYQIAVEAEHPEVQSVELLWHDLPRSQTHRMRQRRTDLQKIFNNTNQLIHRIESEQAFGPKPGPLCDWCEFRDICPAFPRWR